MCAARIISNKIRSADVAKRTASAARQRRSVRGERFLHDQIPGIEDVPFPKVKMRVEPQEDEQPACKLEYAHIAKSMCSIGATNANLAYIFQVPLTTIAVWRTDNEQFSQACRLGEEIADASVERSVFARAVGYDYLEEKIIHQNGRTLVVEQLVHVPADMNAAKFWLTNRRPRQWTEKQRPTQARQSDQGLRHLAEQLKGTAIRPKE